MFKAIFVISFIVAVSAMPMMGPGGLGMGPGPMMGPKELENGLTEEQKTQLHTILENDSATKQQKQDSLKSFFDGIGGNVS
uniref:Uncharacterized protein n=1 Tax=Panagrolaimus sp. ES5 TaxID=591445 RepID=A0AC34FK90_9BILA